MRNVLRSIHFLILFLSIISVSVSCYAAPPAGRNTTINATVDKASPTDTYIWKDESGGNGEYPLPYARNTWVCLSSTDSTNGKCPTEPKAEDSGNITGTTDIVLLFVEKRTGAAARLTVKASRMVGGYGPYHIEAAAVGGSASYTALATFYIPKSEIAKFPTGGIWHAKLNMALTEWEPRQKLADWVAYINLNVTDNNNVQIYFPEFSSAAPRIDLNLRPLPGSGGNQSQMTGLANIDMCLYDGFDSYSSSFTVKFTDQPKGSASRGNDDFSLYHDTGDTSVESGRIDYQVAMHLPDGSTMTVDRGKDNVIPDISSAPVRPVLLPGIPEPVTCVPVPLTLSTKPIQISSKQAGHYTGHLIVDFTPQL
jgi:hypothetical protein